MIRKGRRRPRGLRTRSDNAPANGAMTRATTAPAARMVPLIPSLLAASAAKMVATWSGMMTGTTVNQFANKANHSSDT